MNRIPASWWRNSIRGVLTSAFTFYLLSLSEFGFVDRYLCIFIRTLFWKYTIVYLIIYFVFYFILDLLLRWLAFKFIKNKVIPFIEREHHADRMDFLRNINEIKRGLMNFVMGYPVELGYISTSDLKEVANFDPIIVSAGEKDKAINEVISALNKWACVLIHLVITAMLVWHYDKLLVAIILITGFVLTFALYLGIMLLIQNIEMIAYVVQKEIKKLK